MTTALRPPAGIDDERTRALVQVLNERFDALPVERVLVWHLPTTQAEALAFIAEALGLVGPEFGETGAARTFLTGGVQARRKKGTPAQLRAVLTTLGFGSVELTEGGELLYDDTIAYDGGWTYGYDSHWAVFWVALDIAAPLTEARANQLWDAINEWKPQRCRFVVILRYPDGARTVFRARGEADEIPAPAPGGPDPDEWAGLAPYFDWDPVNATKDGGDVLLTLPDSSGNGRGALLLDGSVYPFVAAPAPLVIAADASFAGAPSLEFAHTSPSTPPTIRTPGSGPGGAFSVALVLYAGPITPTNLYAVSSEGSPFVLYDAGAGDGAWHTWADEDFGEIGASYDYATTPTVLLITSTGESSPGANDATHRFYAKSYTPAVLGGRKPLAAVPWCFGSYQATDGYSLQGRFARMLTWDSDRTADAAVILAALGTKYGISIAP